MPCNYLSSRSEKAIDALYLGIEKHYKLYDIDDARWRWKITIFVTHKCNRLEHDFLGFQFDLFCKNVTLTVI